MKIGHHHQSFWTWLVGRPIQDVRKLVASYGLQRWIDLDFPPFIEIKDVLVFSVELLFGHVSLKLSHQVNSDFDDVVVVVHMISNERVRIRLKDSKQIMIVNVVFKYHLVIFWVPNLDVHLVFPAFLHSIGPQHQEQVLIRLVNIKRHELKLLRDL